MALLVNENDFIQATNLKKFKLEKAAKPLMKLTGLKRLNELYQGLDVYEGSEFIDAAFNRLEIDIELDENDLKHIPTSGPFITISNHPFGLLDGMALLKILYTTRPDFKVMANFLLQHIDPVKDCFISVNPLEDHQNAYSSLKGMRGALGHVRDGKPLGIFPSGEVSSFKKNARTITDREWQLSL
ncbi:MAG: 1-acyl-sn-glycerol-3-phosphate acyltransferase [Bacteroidota bacterium]